MTGCDWSRTCEGCQWVKVEIWPNRDKALRCFAPGPKQGYMVGREHFLPYIPAWCPNLKEEMHNGTHQ